MCPSKFCLHLSPTLFSPFLFSHSVSLSILSIHLSVSVLPLCSVLLFHSRLFFPQTISSFFPLSDFPPFLYFSTSCSQIFLLTFSIPPRCLSLSLFHLTFSPFVSLPVSIHVCSVHFRDGSGMKERRHQHNAGGMERMKEERRAERERVLLT